MPEFGADTRPGRILLVEDNPADVRLTREMPRASKWYAPPHETAGS